ncbi:MAG: hypothetical protein LBT81_02840 [Helicobacteraceae bacterium]|jgi:hypothetical protein|nr:hypothetical protein [Helicobacteraceae bacterium]
MKRGFLILEYRTRQGFKRQTRLFNERSANENRDRTLSSERRFGAGELLTVANNQRLRPFKAKLNVALVSSIAKQNSRRVLHACRRREELLIVPR